MTLTQIVAVFVIGLAGLWIGWVVFLVYWATQEGKRMAARASRRA